MTSAGRFQILEQGQLLLPGKCISCGSVDTNRKYVDLEISVDFFGQIYFCTECFAAIALDLGWVPRGDVTFVEEVYEQQGIELANAKRENEALRNVLAVLCRNVIEYFDTPDDYIRQLVDAVQANEKPVTALGKIPKQSTRSNKSRSIEGSSDVSTAPADPKSLDATGDDSGNEVES